MTKKITDERMMHMHGVAEYMHAHALDVGLNPEKMYVLGLLHDIGYVDGKFGHEARGANILKSLGFETEYFISILWHGSRPSDFLALTKGRAKDVPKELALLWEADMHVNSKGEEVTFDERLRDVRERYPEGNEYASCSEIIAWLKENGRT